MNTETILWIGCIAAGLTWMMAGRRLLFSLGRKWAVTLYGIDIEVSKRYWSREKAMAEADSRNKSRSIHGMGPDWGVKPVLTYHEYVHGSEEGL